MRYAVTLDHQHVGEVTVDEEFGFSVDSARRALKQQEIWDGETLSTSLSNTAYGHELWLNDRCFRFHKEKNPDEDLGPKDVIYDQTPEVSSVHD